MLVLCAGHVPQLGNGVGFIDAQYSTIRVFIRLKGSPESLAKFGSMSPSIEPRPDAIDAFESVNDGIAID